VSLGVLCAVFVHRFWGLSGMIREADGKWFGWICLLLFCLKMSELVDFFDIYVLNLVAT
jgi:hypothetical protein